MINSVELHHLELIKSNVFLYVTSCAGNAVKKMLLAVQTVKSCTSKGVLTCLYLQLHFRATSGQVEFYSSATV